MMPTWSVFAAIALMFLAAQSPPAGDLVITDRMHHLRSGAEREWAEFLEQAEARELAVIFQARANEAEQTLRVRHRDLKQPWRVLLNGTEIAQLPFDEADMVTYWT